MPGSSVTINLPYSMNVVVQSFANAAYMQRVTVQPQGGKATVWTGVGFYDTPLGTMMIQTPPGSGAGFPVTVSVQHSIDNGQTWQPSQVDSHDCQIKYYNMFVVASEDGTDDTWNDATTYFSWTQVPTSRTSSRSAKLLSATPSNYQGGA